MRIVDVPSYSKEHRPDLDAFLARPLFAHLATSSPDGPRDSPVWFLWEDRAIWIISNASDSFWKRVDADPRCAIGIVDFDKSSGLVQHVGMRGRAYVQDWEPQRASRLLTRYLGSDKACWDPRFKVTLDEQSNRWVRFVPETVVVRDQSYTIG